jgi:hypothetical protein
VLVFAGLDETGFGLRVGGELLPVTAPRGHDGLKLRTTGFGHSGRDASLVSVQEVVAFRHTDLLATNGYRCITVRIGGS